MRDWNTIIMIPRWIPMQRSNQTVAGLKRISDLMTREIDQVQIRPLRDWNDTAAKPTAGTNHGSNQTVAGLKRVNCDGTVSSAAVGSNQTVAGLKFYRCIWYTLQTIKFKSDRCGIEMLYVVDDADTNIEFKSDRCGIEILSGLIHYHKHKPRSNQTVAGLKLPSKE